jgi:hypothetical protein
MTDFWRRQWRESRAVKAATKIDCSVSEFEPSPSMLKSTWRNERPTTIASSQVALPARLGEFTAIFERESLQSLLELSPGLWRTQ